jgi:uncharacterized protein involved in exopolysaccharide biosynthesis
MTGKPMSENNQQLQQPYYDGETSLVDLATVFVKRRRVFYGVFGLIVALGLVYALVIAPDVREYTSIVQLAEEDRETLSSPAEIVSIINNNWYPVLQSNYQQTNEEELPFKVAVSNPEETSLIRIGSEVADKDEELVEASHRFIVDQLVEHQAARVEARKADMQQKLSAARERVDELQSRNFTPEAEAKAIEVVSDLKERIGDLQYDLESLKPAQVTLLAHQSAEKKGLSKALILALAIVFGLMLGVFSAFLAEFVAQVRSALKKEA